MILTDVAIRNRTTVFVLILLIVVAGSIAYVKLPRESTPEVKMPRILITTPHQGVTPQDVENTVTNKIEEELTALKGLKEITSVSAEGLSTIQVDFYPDVDIDDALQRVRDKVELAKPELPINTDKPVEPVITEINFAEFPIMMITLSGPISPVRLKVIAERLEDEIEVLPGVLDVEVIGALEREIVVEIDPDRVAQYGLTIPELLKLLPSEHVNQSAGGLETSGTKFNIRIPGEVTDPAEIDKFPLAKRGDRQIYLSDVATVRDTFKDRTSFSRLDGQPSVTLSVKKRVGANIVEIAQAVKILLAKAREFMPKDLKVEIIDDQSKYINSMVLDLENNILTGLVLVVGVLMLFMGFRSSLIVATAIPLSMLISFAVIQAMGYTLNMVVLFGLILALGMLVDNAIVIVENTYRFMELGYSRVEASIKGAAEVAWPVIASTATTVAAFTPLLFWPDVVGDFMKYIPITVIIVLTASLFVAMVINPVICSVAGKPLTKKTDPHRKENRFIRGYRRLLHAALANPMTTLALAVLMLVGVGIFYIKRGHGVEFFPEPDPDQAMVSIRAPQGTNINETDRLTRIVEERIEPFRRSEGGNLRIDDVVANVGSGGGMGLGDGGSGPNEASVSIIFPDFEYRRDPDGRDWKSADVVASIRRRLDDIAGAEIKLAKQKEGPPTGAAVTVRIIGDDMKVLKTLSERAKRLIEDTPNMVNLRSNLEAEKPELNFIPDRKRAALLGVNTAVVSNYLKTALFGTKVADYREFTEEYDIRIRFPEADRSTINDILRIRVPTDGGKAVPISSLGRFEYRPGLGTIHHVGARKRAVTLTADAEGRPGPAVLADVQKRLENFTLPGGYRMEYAGEKEEQDEASAFLKKAFVLALLLIVGILVAQFNTLSVPLIIMTTVVLSMIGVLVGLLVTDQPFGIIMTGVGVISLAGVVVNNAIVLLDYTRQLQRRGRNLLDATIEAGVTRLRPVLLTAGTTILGLVPMSTGVSFDFHTFTWASRSSSSQWWAGMSNAVIFGLGFATMLTLLVVPALYVLTYRLASRFGFGGLRKPGQDLHAAPKPVLEDF